MTIRVAIGTIPKAAGTYIFYRNLAGFGCSEGLEVHCLAVGRREAALWNTEFADATCHLLAPECDELEAQARAVVAWCKSNKIDFILPLSSAGIQAALPHLADSTQVVLRIANIFESGYLEVVRNASWASAIVATTPRQVNDLASEYGIAEEQVALIPNGADWRRFRRAAAHVRGRGARVELGFIGRLEDVSKGVLFLPQIVRQLEYLGTSFRLRIAGEGAYEAGLKRLMKRGLTSGTVEFLGQLDSSAVPKFLKEIDLLLFTSRLEGCPNTLIEAMMAGCVPLAWRLDGINDFIMGDDATNRLFELGDAQSVATRVAQLETNRQTLQVWSVACATRAREYFSADQMSAAYARLFSRLLNEPPIRAEPRPWSAFERPPEAGRGENLLKQLRQLLKRPIRSAMFQLRLTHRSR